MGLVALLLFGGAGLTHEASPVAQDQTPNNHYVLSPDSMSQSGVPQGETFHFVFDHSTIYPGTFREISVYVPAEYKADKPACVYVGLDGLGFNASTVFDNLIYKHEMPVTIAIGIAPGAVASDRQESNVVANRTDTAQGDDPNPRYNRSFEFDSLNANLAHFILEEVFPEVERRKTASGLRIRLSKDPNDRAAGGASTGGIGAFTLAWERPDAFRRVFTAVGTFVGMRGGDHYAVLIRKTAPKPIRIFMQDGSEDEWMRGPEMGDWWMSNQTIERALEFAGYQVKHVWGGGSHNDAQAQAIFPDAMRWLWKDWPQPITAGESNNTFLQAILLPHEDWQVVAGKYQSVGILAADPMGEVVFRDGAGSKSEVIDIDGQLGSYAPLSMSYEGLAFGPDARAYITDTEHATIVAVTTHGNRSTLARNIRGTALLITSDRTIYVVESETAGTHAGKLWLAKPGGEKILLDASLNQPTSIAISPDGRWLALAEKGSRWGYSYRIQSDGTVQEKQQFFWFEVSDIADDSGAGSSAMDRDGRLYVATRMGVQIFDHNGRVRAILPVPGGEAVGLSFGGRGFDTLFVSCADHKIYRRKLKINGSKPWGAPSHVPNWGPF
ncbi:MAG: SMP-30/gluconolactonase/LRE family protein [Candidatus Korobacteraceae bacterium]